MTIRPLILAAAALGTLAAAPALAASIAVEYSDLDLATEHGQQVLERRLDGAARAACGIQSVKTGRILDTPAESRCYKAAREQLDRKFAALVEQAANGG